MLFNGEAIFGVVDFAQRPETAANRARQIADQAKKLGVCAQFYSSGMATLGMVGGHAPVENSKFITADQDICAVVCGELIDRQESDIQYRSEPSRSGLLANVVGAVGLSFLQRLDGTFAAAVWRQSEQQLTLVCDRRADCRLYYSPEGDQLAFSSWLPLLRKDVLEIDHQAVAEFLRFLYIAAPRTIYRGIASVEPGHYISVSRGAVKTVPWVCQTAEVTSTHAHSQSDNELDHFQLLMEQAVARRLGRRRTGVFLSSGVDSATVLAACQKLNPGQVEAFTIGFDGVDLDETNGAKSLARQLGVPHRELRFDLDRYHDAFYRMASNFDQPFGDPAGLPLLLASEAVAGAVEVITGGTGGDDLFGSPIPRHLWVATQVAGRIPRVFRRGLAKVLGNPGPGAVFEFDDIQEIFITWKGWSKRDLSGLLGVHPNFEESGFYRKFREYRSSGPQALFDALGVFPPDDCRFDSAALAGLPIELPYHDADLTAYVQGLPISLRMYDGETKILLRRLFARYFPEGRLPDKKRYFNIPLQALMVRSNFALINDCLAPSRLQKHGLVESSQAWTWINRFMAGEESLRFKVWALLVLHAWLDAR